MANKIEYQIGFKTDQTSLAELKKQLKELQNLSFTDIQMKNGPQALEVMGEIKTQAKNVESALAQAFNPKLNTVNIEQFNKALKDSGSSIEKVYKAFQSGGAVGQQTFRNLTNQVLNANIQLKQTNTILDKMAQTFANTVKWNVASNVIRSMTTSIQQAWGFTKALDGSLNDIRIVTGKSADEMARFAIDANEAAKSLGKTTTDYTKASLIFYQQGLSQEEAEARAAVTLKAANVTGQSADAVSEQLTSVWNGYKVTADEAEVYVDRLAAVAANSASNLEELSVGMSKVASAANAMGVHEDQLAAQLSTIISATRQAPESVGTALRTVYARISDIKAGIDEEGVSLGNYSQKMAEVGISVLDVNGKLRDMGEVMEEIGSKWGDLTREQQVYLAQTMAGQRQYNNLLALFDNFDKYNEMLGIAQESMGTLSKQQSIYMDNFTARLQRLKAATEEIYINFTDTDSIKVLIESLTKTANVIAHVVESLGGGLPILSALGSLGVTVFSKQIAVGLNDVITKFEVAKSNADQFSQKLKETQNYRIQFPELNALLDKREQLLELSGYMKPDQFNEIQNAIGEVNKLADEADLLEHHLKASKDQLRQLTGEPLDKVLADPEKIDAVRDKIDGFVDSFKDFKMQAEEAGKTVQKVFDRADRLSQRKGVTSNLVFKDAFSAAIKEVNTLFKEIEKIKNSDAFDSLSEKAKKEIQEIEIKWQELSKKTINGGKFLSADAYKQLIPEFQKLFSELGNVGTNGANSISKNFEAILATLNDPTVANKLEEVRQRIEAGANGISQSLESIGRSVKIENLSKIAGGISQIGSSLMQLKNIGNIFSSEDLTIGEKTLQIVTNLSFALPLLASGLARTATSLGVAKVAMGDLAKATWASAEADGAKTISILGLNVASKNLTTTIGTMNAALTVTPVGWIIAGLTAVSAVLLGVATHYEKVAKEAKAANDAAIEKSNQTLKEIKENKDLYKSLQELNEQYQKREIYSNDLKSSLDELIDKYGLENEEVNKLKDSYKDLAKYIREARLENIKTAQEANRDKREAAEKNLKAGFTKGLSNGSTFLDTTLTSNVTGDITYALPEDFKADLYEIGAKQSGSSGSLYIEIEDSTEAIEEFYDNWEDIIKKWSRSEDKGVQAVIQKYQKQIDSVQEYRNALKEVEKEESSLSFSELGINAEESGINFSVESFAEYKASYDELEQIYARAISVRSDLEGDASQEARRYIRETYGDLYKQYTTALDFAERLEDKIGKIDNETLELIGNLPQENMSFLDSFKLEDISSWEDLKDIIEYLNTVDLGNLILPDPSSQLTAATDNYNKYASLIEQLESSRNKTINKKEFESLNAEAQKFFTLTAAGSYKMKEDFEDFSKVVKDISLQGFINNINQINASKDRLQKFENDKGVYQRLSTAVTVSPYLNDNDSTTNYSVNVVRDQLAYLTEAGYDRETLIQWMAEFNEGQGPMMVSTLRDISAAIQDTDDRTIDYANRQKELDAAILANELAIASSAENFKELKELYEEGIIGITAYSKAAVDLDAVLDTQDLDLQEWEDYSEYLQKIADESDILDEKLDENDNAAKIVAKSIMKMNDAIETLSSNWENWSDILTNSSIEPEEYFKALESTRDAVADLLDISKDYVSDDFITQHLEEIGQAAEGSEIAIDNLKAALSTSVVAQIIDINGFQSEKDQLLTAFAELQTQIPDLKIGAEFEDEAFINSMNDFLLATGATVDQAQAIFDSLGYEPTFATEPQEVTQTYPSTITETQVIGYTTGTVETPGVPGDATNWSRPILEQISYPGSKTYEAKTIMEVPSISGDGVPKITKVTKKAGGIASNFSSRNAGGGSASKSSKSSGSSAKPSKKNKEKPIEDDRDIYHDINIEIEQAERNLERVQKIQERLFGKDLINNLNEQIALIDKQKEKLLEKQKIQKWDLANQQKELSLLGVTFDEYNNIANYMQILAEGQKKVNDATAEYNNLVDAYNAKGTKEEQEGLDASLEAAKEKLQNATDAYKKLEDKIKNYDQLTVDMADLVDELTEAIQQQVEIRITKFRMNVQIRLDMGEAQRDWNNFKRNVLYKTDILKDTNFDKIFKDAIKDLQDAISYFNVNGSVGSLQALTDQIVRTRKEIEDIDKTGTSAIYGDNKAKAMEDLQNDLKELMSQMENIEELINSIDQAYLDTMEDISDQFNKQIEDYEFINELLQHDMNLLTLLYGEKNFDAMNNYYTQLEANNLKQLDSLKQQAEFWKERWLAAGDDIQAAAMFEEKYKETIKNLNSLIEESAKTLQDKYTNAITGIFDALDKRVSDGKGTDYLSTEWDLINKHADEYLDTINTAFAIQETESKYNKAINDTQSVKNQQALKKLQNEQLEILKNKEKVTQYDVDRAEKLLQIEQARIALEEAQNAKTSMRLKRDSQGNYSYEYVADDNDIAEAQDALNSAMNDLYNFDKAAYKANLNELLGAWKEFETELAAVLTDSALSEEERTEKVALIKEKYGDRINFLTEDNLNIRQNLTESAFADLAQLYETDVESYKSMTAAEQDELLHNIIPIWQSGISAMADEITKKGGFEATCKDAFKEIEDAASEYTDSLKKMAEAAGANFTEVKNGIDPLATELEKLITPTNELMDKVEEQEEKIKSLRLEVKGLRDDWGEVYDAAKKAVSETNKYILEQQKQAAQAAQTAQSSTGNNSGAGSANGAGIGSGAGSTGSGTSGAGTGSGAGIGTAAASASFSNPIGSVDIDSYAKRIASAILVYGYGENKSGWTFSANRYIEKFGKSNGQLIYNKVNEYLQSQSWRDYLLNLGPNGPMGVNPLKFASGGYTGDWAGREGRLALLHQKELVLNQQDTSNLLDAVGTLRTVMSSMNGTFAARANDIRNGLGNLFTNNEAIEQNVHIDASFPNVNSKKEIEEAFAELVNLAAQRVMKN